MTGKLQAKLLFSSRTKYMAHRIQGRETACSAVRVRIIENRPGRAFVEKKCSRGNVAEDRLHCGGGGTTR